jgi:hypothetical protein
MFTFYLNQPSGSEITPESSYQATLTPFNHAVAISSDGNTVIFTNYGENSVTPAGTGNGAAYVYTRSGSTWTLQQRIAPSDVVDNSHFGTACAISADGNTIAVGRGTVSYSTAIYIFTRSGSTWTQEQKIVPGDASYGFGQTVDLSSDGNIMVGGDYLQNSSRGAAYVYTRSGSTWSLQQKITAADGASGDQFGRAVSINSTGGDTVIIGAPSCDPSFTDQGAVFVYTRSGSTWSQEAKIVGLSTMDFSHFGLILDLSSDGNTAVIGSYNSVVGGRSAAYVYTRSGTVWSPIRLIFDYVPGGGVSISLDGTVIVVGGTSYAGGGGTVYKYIKDGTDWVNTNQLIPPGAPAVNDQFGVSIAANISGNTLIIGEGSGGHAYIYV